MPGRVAASLAAHGGHFRAAAEEQHHLNIGPGADLEAAWHAAGLALPDLDALRAYRLGRVREQLRTRGYGGALLYDPMNIRYATDSTNMQVWVMHNAARYAWISTEGPVIVWDFFECDFLSAHNRLVDEVRPAIGTTVFLAGRQTEKLTERWAAELVGVIDEHAGRKEPIAVDQLGYRQYKALEAAGIEIASGQEVMEFARKIKGRDELAAMRCAVHACETTMQEMHDLIAELPAGTTERDIWSLLHAGNIRRAGEWVETQILSSGPRTNPWMQEVSARTVEPGDMVAYDTDLVGAYGMMVDISRSRIAGARPPTPLQRRVFELAEEQILRNTELLTPGRSLTELSHGAWHPPVDEYRHYCCLFHGVGQCDEYPDVFFPGTWNDVGYDDVLEPGMGHDGRSLRRAPRRTRRRSQAREPGARHRGRSRTAHPATARPHLRSRRTPNVSSGGPVLGQGRRILNLVGRKGIRASRSLNRVMAPGESEFAEEGNRFAAMYDAHVDEVYRFVHRRCRDHSLSEDITQETFLTAIRSTDDTSSISAGWLITVARNRLIDELRRRARHEERLRLLKEPEATSEAAELAERMRVERALNELSIDHRLVLTLHYIDGFTVPALAEHLGRTLKSVEGLVTRARRELRDRLDADDDMPDAGGAHG